MPDAPAPHIIARRVVSAMLAREPIPGLSWAVARDDDGEPLYLVAIVLGSENCADFEGALEHLQPHMKRVDIFDGTPGEPDLNAEQEDETQPASEG